MNADDIIKLFLDESDDLAMVEEGDWVQDGKYQLASHIVKHIPTGDHWRVRQTRAGSYYSDFEVFDTSAERVNPQTETVVITKWVKA